MIKKSEIIFWLTMFFSFSYLVGLIFGIKMMVGCWLIFSIMWLFFEFTIQYKKMLERIFD